MKKTPDFICIGAHKCGTSWLSTCLYEHPELFMKDKIDFFYSKRKLDLGYNWYASQFKNANKKLTGEISTVYFFSEQCAKSIYDYNPKTKLLLVLRNPIDRAFSHYIQDIKMKQIPLSLSFEQAIEENSNIIEWGFYKKHLSNYLKVFPQENLKIILLDDIKSNPKKTIKSVYNYLKIDGDFIPTSINKKINSARIPKNYFFDNLKRRISNSLKKYSLGTKIWLLIKHSKLMQLFYRFNSLKKDKHPKLQNVTRKKLQKLYKTDIEYIAKKLNREDLNWL